MNDSFNELTLSNYWDGRFPDTGFARKSYTNRIFGYIGNKLIKVLFGQRGAGRLWYICWMKEYRRETCCISAGRLPIPGSFPDVKGLKNFFPSIVSGFIPWGRSIYSLKKYRISMVGRSLSVHIHKITSIVANCLSVVRTEE